MKKSEYRKLVDRILLPKLLDFGFSEISLSGCMDYEALFRKKDLWLGTSWDYRDRYLDLNLGHLYWFKDVMPRVVVVGEYSSHCSRLKRIDTSAPDYLESVLQTVAETIEDAIISYNEHPESTTKQLSRLRQLLSGQAADSELSAFGA
jgi:hypothetical protein